MFLAVPGERYGSILNPYRKSAAIIESSDLDYTILRRGIYYYDGWSAFTVLFGDAHIAPFEVVHIGDMNEDVISPLAAAGATIKAKIKVN